MNTRTISLYFHSDGVGNISNKDRKKNIMKREHIFHEDCSPEKLLKIKDHFFLFSSIIIYL